jgi:hypothetical protein
MRKLAVVVFALLFAACGGGEGTSLTGPSSSIPNVAGNYTGSTTLTFPELSQSVSCPTSTSVTQSGNTISIAPIVVAGQCGNVSIPFGQTSIDATGSLGQATTTYTEACGTYNVTASGGFFGRELRISMSATSGTCYNINMTMTLTR